MFAISERERGSSCAATSVQSARGLCPRISQSSVDWHHIDAGGVGQVIMVQAVAGVVLDAADHIPYPISDGLLNGAVLKQRGSRVHKYWQGRRLCFPILPQVFNSISNLRIPVKSGSSYSSFLGRRILLGEDSKGSSKMGDPLAIGHETDPPTGQCPPERRSTDALASRDYHNSNKLGTPAPPELGLCPVDLDAPLENPGLVRGETTASERITRSLRQA